MTVVARFADCDLNGDWSTVLEDALGSPDGIRLERILQKHRAGGLAVYPPSKDVFLALNLTPLSQVKVVILGQDPYHGAEQAHGLAFSVPPGIKAPPSLRNILKERSQDLAIPETRSTCLKDWAEQGVLLLNTVLTVTHAQPASHAGLGWETITDEVIRTVSRNPNRVVFILWGAQAFKKRPLIDQSRHLILYSAHPSPLSAHRGFFGSKPFSKANAFLEGRGSEPIRW